MYKNNFLKKLPRLFIEHWQLCFFIANKKEILLPNPPASKSAVWKQFTRFERTYVWTRAKTTCAFARIIRSIGIQFIFCNQSQLICVDRAPLITLNDGGRRARRHSGRWTDTGYVCTVLVHFERRDLRRHSDALKKFVVYFTCNIVLSKCMVFQNDPKSTVGKNRKKYTIQSARS